MKPLTLILLFCLSLTLQAHSGRAQDVVPAPLQAAITQLDANLLVIPPGSTVTDAQHQAIVADLNALAAGIIPAPAPGDLDSLATILGNAAVVGNVTSDSLAELNSDLAADATDPDDWLDDLTNDAYDLLSPDDTDPGPIIIDPTLPYETAVPVFTTATAVRPRRTHQSHNFVLDVQSGQSPLNQFYNGLVGLHTKQVAGSAPVTTISVRAVGLPKNNPYTVTITRKSDGAAVTLGQFAVRDVSRSKFNRNLTAAIPEDYDAKVENLTLGHTVFGGSDSQTALPSDFDVRDVATLTLLDALGVARLSGHPAAGINKYWTRGVVLHLYGDATAAPTASAVAKANKIGGVNTFYLTARHLPASTPVTLVADGVAVGQFTTGAHGRLLVTEGNGSPRYNRAGVRLYPQTLPNTVRLFKVQSLALTDAQGNVLLSSPTP